MREFMNITKALADENRVRTLLALREGRAVRLPDHRVVRAGAVHRVQAPVHPLPGRAGGVAQGRAAGFTTGCRARKRPWRCARRSHWVAKSLAENAAHRRGRPAS